MKIFILLLALLIPTISHAEEKVYGSVWATVVKIYDGDTLTVNVDSWPEIVGSKIGVRVYGVDTREMKAGGEKAKEFVKSLLPENSKVCLSGILRDKYFRIVSKVGYDCKESPDPQHPCALCKDLSVTLLVNNYALPYFGKTKLEFPEDIK